MFCSRCIQQNRSHDPLENHVATVAKYVDRVWHKKHKLTSDLTPTFTQYIVARSWEKMDRRIRHWSSRRFLSNLVAVKENALQAAVEPTVTLSQNDATLSLSLLAMNDKALTSIMKNCPKVTTRPTITSLLTACQDMQSYPRPESQVQSDDRSGLYTRDTCFEFHRLLISTLLGYRRALNKLQKTHRKYCEKPGVQNQQKMVDYIKEVWKCGSLLWDIAYSQILGNHLSVLHREGWLRLPVKERNPSFNEESDDEVGQDDGGRDEGGGGEGGGDEGGWDDEGEDQGGKIEDEEFSTISNILLSDSKGIDKAFLEWIRLQVDRWQAPRKITSFVKRARTPPTKFTLLAVKHPEPMPTDEAIEPWKDTIRHICARTRVNRQKFQADEVIRILEDRIIKGVKAKERRIYDKFDSNQPATVPYRCTPHCEAVLGCLSKFHRCVAGDDTLKKCLEV